MSAAVARRRTTGACGRRGGSCSARSGCGRAGHRLGKSGVCYVCVFLESVTVCACVCVWRSSRGLEVLARRSRRRSQPSAGRSVFALTSTVCVCVCVSTTGRAQIAGALREAEASEAEADAAVRRAEAAEARCCDCRGLQSFMRSDRPHERSTAAGTAAARAASDEIRRLRFTIEQVS